jgi:arylsulfatase
MDMSYSWTKSCGISRRSFLKAASAGLAAAMGRGIAGAESLLAGKQSVKKPNFIIFFTDDQGYNDVGCFGSPFIRTPNLDRMAKEGMKFTSFYAQPVCGPSRAALMTGCYPIRVAEPGNKKNQHTVLHPKEITVAEVLKSAGYATALIGKWHLAGGRKNKYEPRLMPNAQGFDHFLGTPLHNGFTRTVDHKSFRTQLMRDGHILKDALDQDGMNSLTGTYTEEAVKFIRANKNRPFFLYLAHNMPHVPLGASGEFRGRSRRRLYGDVIEELDWSAGRILKTLKDLDLDDNTLIVFTSDNGPWIEGHLGDYGGSAAPLRGWKMSAWEGGPRVPCIMRWPGRIPSNAVCHEMVTTMDLLPTFAKLARAQLPGDRIIDGRAILSLMTGEPGAKSPHEAFYFYNYLRLNAVRSGKWKLVLPRPANPPGTGWSGRMIDAVSGYRRET